MRARTCVVRSCATLAACLFPDLGSLDGDDAGGGDVGADTNKPDVITDGGGADAPSDAPFCKRADHSLCDDFDELPFAAAWTGQHVATATLAADDAAGLAAPTSTAQMLRLRLGFQEYIGTFTRIRYDDVACDVTP